MKLKVLTFCVLAGLLWSCGRTEYRRAAGAAWGTVYHITYRADRDLADSVVAEMRRVELSLSMFDAASTVSRVNAGETDVVDSMFRDVYAVSALVNRLTGGFFDPTVAPLVDLWGFGRRGVPATPSAAEVDSVLRRVGIGRSRLDGLRLHRVHPDMEFDFSAVAKGYGVDRVAAMLERNGVRDYMVEIGGEVRTAGRNPSGQVWRIAIESPASAMPGDSAMRVIELDNAAVATSGNYRNFRGLSADSVIGHTINPLTGYPEARQTVSATVIAPDCALADALATACMLLSPDSAMALRDSLPGVRIILLTKDGKLLE